MNVITLTPDALVLRFPAGQFYDVTVRDLLTTPDHGTAGNVHYRRWNHAEIAHWRITHARWEQYGRHIARTIRRLGRPPQGNGLIQRVLAHYNIVMVEPPDRSTVITDCTVINNNTLRFMGNTLYKPTSPATRSSTIR